MKAIPDYEKDLSSIRDIMEKSVKFVSLSGLSGVLAGIYAIVGAVIAYYTLYYPASPFDNKLDSVLTKEDLPTLIAIALGILVISVITGLWFSKRKAEKHNSTFWNAVTKRLCVNLAIPLLTGGIFILVLLYHGYYELAAPACLIFYGLALLQTSSQTFEEIRLLGLSEIAVGLIAALIPGYGPLFWTLGFGVLHVIYGSIMHFRYDK